MSIKRTLVFFVLYVVASELTTNINALSEVPLHGHSTIQYVDNPVGSPSGIVTLPSAVPHAEDRSGNRWLGHVQTNNILPGNVRKER